MLCACRVFADDAKLTGRVIGSEPSIDYQTGESTTTINTTQNAFDGDAETFFAANDADYSWVGLDLGTPHIITRIGWQPKAYPNSMKLGIFEGANREDFMDAIPLAIIDEDKLTCDISYTDIVCSKGFRYVRYIGPVGSHCHVAELEFYGTEGEGNFSQLVQLTNLPTISIHTLNNQEPVDKVNQIFSQITLISENGTRILTDTGTIRLRGNFSMNLNKKPYRIKFYNKHNVLNSPAKAKKWVLLANYPDKTLLRNDLAFMLSRQIGMSYTPFCAFVDVVINGEYKGNYLLCDQITVNKNRINIQEMTPQCNSGDSLTGGYFLEVDNWIEEETSIFYSTKNTGITIKYPDEKDITPEQAQYIEDHYNKMESNWKKYLDVRGFLKRFLVEEFAGNGDEYESVFFYKDRNNDTIYVGPVWDFDIAFENDERVYPVGEMQHDFLYRYRAPGSGYMRTLTNLIIVRDAYYAQMLSQFWSEARNSGLTIEQIFDYIDSQQQLREKSRKLNFIRWPIINKYIWPNPVVYETYEQEIEHLKNFINVRIQFMDNKLGYVRTSIENKSKNIDYSQDYEVFDLLGKRVGNNIVQLTNGIYIVRQGTVSNKIVVK